MWLWYNIGVIKEDYNKHNKKIEKEQTIMHHELKRAITNWLLDNPNTWQRVNACHEEFRAYIYNADGNYLIGGKEVSEFISKINKVIYG